MHNMVLPLRMIYREMLLILLEYSHFGTNLAVQVGVFASFHVFIWKNMEAKKQINTMKPSD